jgi:hypothetical protein
MVPRDRPTGGLTIEMNRLNGDYAIRWSLNGLQTAARIARNDFTMTIGSECFHCDRFQAAFLSPLTANAIADHPTINQLVIGSFNSSFTWMKQAWMECRCFVCCSETQN